MDAQAKPSLGPGETELFTPRPPTDRSSRWHQRWVVPAFLVLIALGPILSAFFPPMRTQASVPPPSWSSTSPAELLDGSFTRRLEKYLEEASPLVAALRGHWNEVFAAIGWLDAPRVVIGEDGWFFLRESVALSGELERATARRRVHLAAIRAEADELGVELLAVVVPSKVSVYPEHYRPADERERSRLASLYPRILSELAAAGIPAVDLLAVFRAARRERPQDHLYYRRDTHWTAEGAWLAGRSVRDRIVGLGWLPRCGPLRSFRAMAIERREEMPDLAGMLGFRPWGRAAAGLRADKYFLGFQDAAGDAYGDVHPDAAVALAGTSFSAGGLHRALPHELVRDVDCRGVLSGGGIVEGLEQTFARIRQGGLGACRVLVWELVEHRWVVL